MNTSLTHQAPNLTQRPPRSPRVRLGGYVILAQGKGDGEMLAWIEENAPNNRSPWEIQQWSAYHSERGRDGDVETLEFFANLVGGFSKTREDVRTWFDCLDLDDHVTFGGKA